MNSRNVLHEEHESGFDHRVNGWLGRRWKTPTGLKVLIYDISLSLFPAVTAAVATAIMKSNLPFLFFTYLLYIGFVVLVIMSRRIIALQVCGKSDLSLQAIAIGILIPALATGVVQFLLEGQMILNLGITLVLAAVIAGFSQLYLALPKEYRQKAEECPVARIENKVLNLFIVYAVVMFFVGIGSGVRIIIG